MGHVERKGERREAYWIVVGKPEGKSHLEYPGVDRRIILKWIFRKWMGTWTGLMRLRIGTSGGLL